VKAIQELFPHLKLETTKFEEVAVPSGNVLSKYPIIDLIYELLK
jgi:hypothetical protein